jgi:hypothetical protein
MYSNSDVFDNFMSTGQEGMDHEATGLKAFGRFSFCAVRANVIFLCLMDCREYGRGLAPLDMT